MNRPLSSPANPAVPPVLVTAAALLALHAALAWYLRSPAIGTGNDDAVYVLLARSLRHGGYGDLFYVGAPTEAQYPPLYPSFLALLGGLFGEHLSLFLAANVLLSVIGLALLFDVVRRRDPVVAVLALAIMTINPLLLSLAGGVRSEPLCMALTALSLWLLAFPGRSRGGMVGAGGAAIGAALSRSAAVTLVAAVWMSWVLRRRWGAVFGLSLAAALTIGSWLTWTLIAPRQLAGRSYVADATLSRPAPAPDDTTTHVDSVGTTAPPPAASSHPGLLGTLALRLRTNLRAYGGTLLETLGVPTVANTKVDNAVWLLLLTTMGAVGIWGLSRWWMVAALVLGCQGLLLAFWPYALARYLAPILELIAIAVLWGTRETENWVRGRLPRLGLRRLLPIGLATGILAGAIPRIATQVRTSAACRSAEVAATPRCVDPVERAFFEATRSIARTTPDTARFIAAKEGAFYYYTGRQVVPIYPVTAGRVPDLREYMSTNHAEYVFLSHLKIDEWVIARPLLAMCEEFELVQAWGPATLLLRVSDSAVSAEQNACAAIRDYDLAPWGERR